MGTDGIITLFAGSGAAGYSGDGGLATSAAIGSPGLHDIAVAPDGSVFIADGNDTVRWVDRNGIISTYAGIPNPGAEVFSGDHGPATAAAMGTQIGIRVAPDRSLYIADHLNDRVRHVQPPLPGFSFGTSTIQIASRDGTQVYTFNGNGRHLETSDAVTGAALYQFSYDGAGRLSAVADVNDNVTQINHDGGGNPTSIVGPFGQATTALGVDANGYLASIANSAQSEQFTYSAQGLMASMTDGRGGLHQFAYDASGALAEEQDPAGGSQTLAASGVSGGVSVDITTGLGRQSTYQTTVSSTGTFGRLNTFPDGTQASLQLATNGATTTTGPDGTTTTTTEAPDPRFGILSPLLTTTTKTPSGVTSVQSTARTFTTSGGALATFTELLKLNGNTTTRVFNATTRQWTTTSPLGRQSTTTVDADGRPTQVSVPGVTPIAYLYDGQGRLATMSQGAARTWTMGYDPSGYPSSVTDPLTHVVSHENDALGRAIQTVVQDGRAVGTTYDGNGNPTVVTLPDPADNVHDFAYTPVDLVSTYTPPSVGSSPTATSYLYNIDQQPTTVTRPDGVTLTYGYDAFGRLNGVTYPQGTLSRTYNPTTGQLATLTSPGGEALAYTYDGFLRTGVTWTGPVAGSLSFGYDSNFRVHTQTVDGTSMLLFGFDADSLLTPAGALTVGRDAQNGRVTGTTLGALTDAYSYDANGLLATYTASYNGAALYSENLEPRDALGRITQKTETLGGATHVFAYTYDPAGRLTDVTEDGAAVSHYGYDQDDNRNTVTNASGTIAPTYDAQDRLLTYGSASYSYTANGELTTKTVGAQATGYTYDALGNLLHVGLSSGTNLDYVVDGENRRVGKEVGGSLTTGLLYEDALHVVAQLDGNGNVVARFVFGSRPNVPDYYTTATGTFRILSDHLGSPRLIVDTSSGNVVERIDYDEFGNLTGDTNPGLIPFGFAGGLYDPDTGLVRFGARDYDASVGRWTAKDPIRFDGGSLNLYGYVLNDPVNEFDEDGTSLRGCAQAIAALLPTIWKVNQRMAENAVCPDPGHNKAIDQAKNRLQQALAAAQRACTAQDIATLGVAGVLAGGAAALLFGPVGGGAALLCCP